MRHTAVRFAGVAAVTGLLVMAPLIPAYAVERPTAARPPAAGCNEAKAQNYERSVPAAQAMLGTGRVWPLSTGAGVTVAVLDSGVDVRNGQLNGKSIGSGVDFLRKKGSGHGRYDCDGHGTAVASLIAAKPVTGYGFQGLAYDATVLPVVVSEQHDEAKNTAVTRPDRLARAVNWAVGHGADIINISFPIYRDHPALRQAIASALARDVVVVASAGTGAPEAAQGPGDGPPYPAAYHGVIGVAAVDAQTAPLKPTPWEHVVDLVAPGGEVLASNRSKGHIRVSGSGFATAFVSASAALVRSRWPHLSAGEVERRLFATASPAAGSEPDVGHGIVDPYRALTESLSREGPTAPSAGEPPSPDPAEVARDQEWQHIGQIALAVAAVSLLLAVAMLATLTLLPKGFRRGWRPGRARSFPEPPDDDSDLPPAPVKLFENLEAD